jgi:hypothetical protein
MRLQIAAKLSLRCLTICRPIIADLKFRCAGVSHNPKFMGGHSLIDLAVNSKLNYVAGSYSLTLASQVA